MQKYQNPILAQADTTATSSGPKWIPVKQDWPWIAGAITVAALAAGLVFMGSRTK